MAEKSPADIMYGYPGDWPDDIELPGEVPINFEIGEDGKLLLGYVALDNELGEALDKNTKDFLPNLHIRSGIDDVVDFAFDEGFGPEYLRDIASELERAAARLRERAALEAKE